MFIPDDFDSYIIVSFVNATLVLSIGETVEEVTDSGFLGTTPTLSCSALGDDALVQVWLQALEPLLFYFRGIKGLFQNHLPFFLVYTEHNFCIR